MEKEVKEEFFHWMFATCHRSPSFSLKSTWTESRDRREKKKHKFFFCNTSFLGVWVSFFKFRSKHTHTHLFIALCTKVPISICSCLLPNIELKKWEKKFREKIIFFFFFHFVSDVSFRWRCVFTSRRKSSVATFYPFQTMKKNIYFFLFYLPIVFCSLIIESLVPRLAIFL